MPYVPSAASSSASPANARQQVGQQPRTAHGLGKHLVHRAVADDRQRRVGLAHGRLDDAAQARRRQRAPHDDVHVALGEAGRRHLLGKEVDLGAGLLVHAALLDVLGDRR